MEENMAPLTQILKLLINYCSLTLTVECSSNQVNVHIIQHVLQNGHNTSLELAQVIILKNTSSSCLY